MRARAADSFGLRNLPDETLKGLADALGLLLDRGDQDDPDPCTQSMLARVRAEMERRRLMGLDVLAVVATDVREGDLLCLREDGRLAAMPLPTVTGYPAPPTPVARALESRDHPGPDDLVRVKLLGRFYPPWRR